MCIYTDMSDKIRCGRCKQKRNPDNFYRNGKDFKTCNTCTGWRKRDLVKSYARHRENGTYYVDCDCGSSITFFNMQRHLKSIIHTKKISGI